MIPMKSYGDGNCLFRSLSLIIFGHERNHTEVRVHIIIELACNEELYLSEKTFEDMLNTVMMVSWITYTSIFYRNISKARSTY